MFGKATLRIFCVGLIVLSTWLLSYSGWRGRILNPDLIPAANATIEFEQTGKFPEKSCLSSTCGYDPPGTSWLLLPGIIMFRDARLFEAPGTLILHCVTIAGFIVIGTLLGASDLGIFAAVFYSVGPRGLFFASSLWPRSHPAFCVWTIAFLLLYLKSRRSYYFGLAILTFGLGLLVFLEMAPMGIAFPLAIIFGPRSRRLAVYAAASVILVIAVWTPYLRFERTRNFEDLQTLLTRGECPVVPVSSYNWCSRSRTPVYATVTNHLVVPTVTLPQLSGPKSRFREFAGRLIGNVSPSFAVNWRGVEAEAGFPFLTSLRSVIFVLGLIAVFLRCSSKLTAHSKWRTSKKLLFIGGIVSIIVGAALNPRIIGMFTRSGTFYDLMSTYSSEALWLGVLLLALGGLLVVLARKEASEQISANPTGYQLLIGTYGVSWIFWALVGGDYRYFFWLWPMQALIMAVGIDLYFPIFSAGSVDSRRKWALVAAVAGLMAANGSFTNRVSGWVKGSWAGKDDPIVSILDQIADERRHESTRTTSIVYEIPVREYIPIVGALDRMYVPGMEYNLYLREKYALENSVQCVGVPTFAPDYLIRDEKRRLKSGIGEFVWFDVDSQLARNMNIVSRRGSITLLARVDRAISDSID